MKRVKNTMELLVLLFLTLSVAGCSETGSRGPTLQWILEIDDARGQIADRDAALDAVVEAIQERLDELGVRRARVVRVGGDRIQVEVEARGTQADPTALEPFLTYGGLLEFKIVTDGSVFEDALPRIDRAIVSELGSENLGTARSRQEAELSALLLGAADTAAQQDADAEADPTKAGASAELRPLTDLISAGRIPGEFLVLEQDVPLAEGYLEPRVVQSVLPRGISLNWGTRQEAFAGASYRALYALEAEPILTGEMLADAGPATRNPTYDIPLVPIELTRPGGEIFERATARHIGDNMAIVLDDRVLTYAVIRDTLSRRIQIELGPGAQLEEARDLVIMLRSALPAPVIVVETRVIDPAP